MSLAAELHAHLLRLAALAGVGLVAALASEFRRLGDGPRAFARMSAAWFAVDLLIALPGLLRPSVPEPGPFGQFLAFNLGLNLGYLGVGAALVILGSVRVRGSGAAVAVQGVLLLALDGWLYARAVG